MANAEVHCIAVIGQRVRSLTWARVDWVRCATTPPPSPAVLAELRVKACSALLQRSCA
jgi:hypothetical protein